MEGKHRQNRFLKLEDLEAWQEARKLSIGVGVLLRSLEKKIPYYDKFNIIPQMRRDSRSIPANIAEGYGRFYFRDSALFYRIARGSLYELKSDLYYCLDERYINQKIFKKFSKQIERVGQLVNGLIRSAIRLSRSQ